MDDSKTEQYPADLVNCVGILEDKHYVRCNQRITKCFGGDVFRLEGGKSEQDLKKRYDALMDREREQARLKAQFADRIKQEYLDYQHCPPCVEESILSRLDDAFALSEKLIPEDANSLAVFKQPLLVLAGFCRYVDLQSVQTYPRIHMRAYFYNMSADVEPAFDWPDFTGKSPRKRNNGTVKIPKTLENLLGGTLCLQGLNQDWLHAAARPFKSRYGIT